MRSVAAIGFITVSMLGVAAMALFLSTLTDSPQAASLGALAFLIGSSLLLTVDAARPLQPYLPTRYWLSFVDLYRDPDPVEQHRAWPGPAGCLRRRAARGGLGQLRDPRHHELRPRVSPPRGGPQSTGARSGTAPVARVVATSHCTSGSTRAARRARAVAAGADALQRGTRHTGDAAEYARDDHLVPSCSRGRRTPSPGGTASRSRRASSGLSGASCWQAVGQAPETSAPRLATLGAVVR